MDSDDSNISDHVGDLDIQPYQLEPLCNNESQQEREHSTSEDSDIDAYIITVFRSIACFFSE
jgi:hypothetical protein